MQSPIEWLVTPPEGMSTIDSLTQACRGHRNLAHVLYYFLYVGRYEVQDQGIDKDTAEFVTVTRKQDKILEGIEKYVKVKMSKKTFIELRDELRKYDFVHADGRRHTHDVYWKKVQKAMDNPPPPDAPKLRGKHAPKLKEESEEGQKVKTTNSPVKTTSRAQAEGDLSNCSFEDLTEKVVVLTKEVEVLSREFVNLTERFVNLQIEKSQEEARRAELEGKIDALYNLYNLSNNFNINSLTNGGTANAVAPQEESKEKENNVIELSSRKTSQPSQTKSRTSKSKNPVLPLQLTLPDLDAAPTLESIMQLGDYIRGCNLAQKDVKACREGAIAMLQRKFPLRDIAKVLVYMSRRDDIREEFGMKFKDEGYLNGNYQPADLCNIYRKVEDKLKEIAKLEKQHNEPAPTTTAQHILPTSEAEPLNETAENAQERLNKQFTEDFIKRNPVVFWTTTKDINTIRNAKEQPLEVLQTWQNMPVQEAIDTYGLNPRFYCYVPPLKNSLLSQIAVLTSRTVSA